MNKNLNNFHTAIKEGKLAVITDIQRFSVHDGPGIRTIVFFKGCPLRCRWCQNPETWNIEPEILYYEDMCIHCGRCVTVCPVQAITMNKQNIHMNRNACIRCGACSGICYAGAMKAVGTLMSPDEILQAVLKDRTFYKQSGGGVTLSGGECTVYAEFICTLLKKLKEHGIHTAIETCGQFQWNRLEEAISYADLFLFDIKVTDPSKSQYYTGQNSNLILENLRRLRSINKHVVLRFPMIPGVNDDDSMLFTIVQLALDNNISELHIMPFHQLGSSKWSALNRQYTCFHTRSPSDSELEHAKKILSSQGMHVSIGGSGS